MPSIAVDAGPLVALFDRSDKYHADALRFVKRVEEPLLTNLLVIAEVAALLPLRFQLDLLEWAKTGVDIDRDTVVDISRVIELMQKYADLPADLADASLVALCERRGIELVASLDRHFDVYRTSDRKRLKNVFFSAGTS